MKQGFTPLHPESSGLQAGDKRHNHNQRCGKDPRLSGGDVTGFTLLEIVIVLGIVAILIAGAILVINPAQELARARNNERRAHLNTLVNAIGQNIADNNGIFNCGTGPIPTATTTMADNNPVAGQYNIAPCLVPIYLQNLPFDPASTTAFYLSVSDYYTAYTIARNSTTGRITLGAPGAEVGEVINVTR